MAHYDGYQTPLSSRYGSPQMKKVFSARTRAQTWRKLWLWLAEAEKELGVTEISDQAVDELRAHLDVSDEAFQVIAAEERRRRHDVMSHVHAFGQEAPAAAGIIHYAATSCFVTDNADLIFIRDALEILKPKLAKVISNISKFSLKWKDMPVLGFTHYQPAQPITLGLRASSWVFPLLTDLTDLERASDDLKLRGAQGTVGSQASFLDIFHGDGTKIDQLNEKLCKKAGFPSCYDISTQTYSRKVDFEVAKAVAGLGASTFNIANNIRLMCHDQVLDEPHEKTQIGSSAMSYKSNPMRCERICSLSRKLTDVLVSFANTFSVQWMERTLDDSAIRRIDIPEMFLLADEVLTALDNVTDGLVVFPAMFERQLALSLPYLTIEAIIVKCVRHGLSRQDAHEQTRIVSSETAKFMKEKGGDNDLFDRIKKNEFFKPIWNELDGMLDASLYIGRSPELVSRYLAPDGPVQQKLQPYHTYLQTAVTAQLSV